MRLWIHFALLVFGCNVESTAENTGGVAEGRGGVCPDGISVVLSDYLSSQIALCALDGRPQSAAFLSSGSSATSGLAFPISGDVVLPSERPASGKIVVIDRYGTNVISWADPVRARVTAQLAVATGFEANPQDYIEVAPNRAYVSRWGHNHDSGREAFDAGDDLLVIDPEKPSIIGRISLAEGDDLPPRASRFVRVHQRIVVTLQRLSLDLVSLGDSELVGIDPETDSVVWRSRIDGMRSCGGAVLAPSGVELALSCSGKVALDGNVSDLAESGLVFFDVRQEPPREIRRFGAEGLAGSALQHEIAFANSEIVLFKTQTALGGASHNRLLSLDRRTGNVTEILVARPAPRGRGQGIVFGGLLCSPGCSDLCLLADADRGVLQRLRVAEDGSVYPDGAVSVENRVGLPPLTATYR